MISQLFNFHFLTVLSMKREILMDSEKQEECPLHNTNGHNWFGPLVFNGES